MTDTDLTAVLAAIRERSEHHIDPSFRGLGITNPDVHALLMSGGDVPPLLAAVEAVLKLADDWSAEPIPRSSSAGSVRAANTLRATGNVLHRSLSAALLGEGGSGG